MLTILRQTPNHDFPYRGTSHDRLLSLLGFAILAPSFRNAQPWRFEVGEHWVDISIDPNHISPVADPDGRERTMDVGAAIDHLSLAMRWHLMEPRVEYFPDADKPNLLARIVHDGDSDPSTEDLVLFSQIEKRHTAVVFSSQQELHPGRLEQLEEMATERGAGMVWIRHGAFRREVAEMVKRANELHFDNELFRKELSTWTREDHADWEAAGDGVSAEQLGITGLVRHIFPWLVAHVDLGTAVGKEEMIRAATAPALGVLCTRGDERRDWLDAGQALSRLLLRGCASGLRGSFLNAPMEIPGMRIRLREDLRLVGFPQALVQIGPGPEGKPTPRRPLESFID